MTSPTPIPPPAGPGSLTGNEAPWNLSAYDIVFDAYSDAKLKGQGEELNSEELVNGMRRLAKLINYLQTKGVKLWLQQDVAVPIVAGENKYSMSGVLANAGLYPKRIVQGYFQYTNTALTRYPLIPLSWNEWLTLGAVTQGPINSYFVDKQSTDLLVTFWLTPDASVVAQGQPHLLVQMQALNYSQATNQTSAPSFPPEWALALEWGLASQICSGQPQAVIDRCDKMAAFFQTELENWDVEDTSTSFQPDQRAVTVSRFK